MYLEPVAFTTPYSVGASDAANDQYVIPLAPRPADPVEVEDEPEAQTDAGELSVLTYNVRGLPWPVAKGRGAALKAIGRELAALRAEGRQPDVVLIQEGFRSEVADLVRESGYAYWAQGPRWFDRAPKGDAAGLKSSGWNPMRGEGLGKVFGAGLHVLSDAPIVDVRNVAFRHCAGIDCLANKGAMMVRITPAWSPTPIDIVNTHMNSRKASKAPRKRTLLAHNLQTRELAAFIRSYREAGHPMLVGGDFNIRNSAARYDFEADARPYTVVSEYCAKPVAACGIEPDDIKTPLWLRSQDLQAFGDGAVRVLPIRAESLAVRRANGRRLSDHDGYLVRYRLSWSAEAIADLGEQGPISVKPQFKTWGVKVSWKH